MIIGGAAVGAGQGAIPVFSEAGGCQVIHGDSCVGFG